jgi:hypothetical protein
VLCYDYDLVKKDMNWDDLDDRLIVRKDIKTIFYEPEI